MEGLEANDFMENIFLLYTFTFLGQNLIFQKSIYDNMYYFLVIIMFLGYIFVMEHNKAQHPSFSML